MDSVLNVGRSDRVGVWRVTAELYLVSEAATVRHFATGWKKKTNIIEHCDTVCWKEKNADPIQL